MAAKPVIHLNAKVVLKVGAFTTMNVIRNVQNNFI